jgi:hypothetical protein
VGLAWIALAVLACVQFLFNAEQLRFNAAAQQSFDAAQQAIIATAKAAALQVQVNDVLVNRIKALEEQNPVDPSGGSPTPEDTPGGGKHAHGMKIVQ